MGFWQEFFSNDDTKVNTATVIASFLCIPVMLLAMAVLIYHCFILKKGLDNNVVTLILGLLGGGGLGYGIGRSSSLFSRRLTGPPPDWQPPPLKK